jgi:ligand-binding sensor domain-containing protein
MLLKHILVTSILVATFSACAAGTEKQPDAKPPTSSIGVPVSETEKAIFHVFQARNNDYWFGSESQGVYRFDGKTLIHFTTKDGLANDRIRGIQEDKSGNIYFTTMDWDGARHFADAISKFDGKTFSTIRPTENTSAAAWKLQPDDLWFAGAQDSGVVYRYDGRALHRLRFPKTKAGEAHISKYPRSDFPNMTFSPYDVYIIYKDRKGNIWFGTNLGVCCYDGNSFTWISEEELGFDETGSAFNVRSIIEDQDGRFLFSNTLHRWDVSRNSLGGHGVSFTKAPGIEPTNPQNPTDFAYFMSSVTDDNGDLWMATLGAGVWRYDGKNLTHYPVKDGNSSIRLFSIYRDNQGGLWLGSHAAGVFKFTGKTFEPFRFR